MFNVTGYFNEKCDEYTLTTPKTRADYRTCLMNNRGYAFALNQFGMGETLCKFAFTEKNTILANGNRTVYFRDDETNDVWCVGGFPFVSEVEDFTCTHKPSCSVISSVHNGIRVTIRFFVPRDKRCDIQTVRVENLTDTPRKISIFPAMQLQLTGFDAPAFCDNFEQTYLTSFREEINGLYIDGRNPYTFGKPYNAFLTSTTPVHAYSADDRVVFGSQYSLSEPYAIMDGEDLDSKSVAAGKLCFVLQTKTELLPKQSFETDYILGVSVDFEGAKKELADLRTHEEVEAAYAYSAKADLARRSKLMIETPHEETNYFINYWMKLGLEYNILWRRAPRDNLQFVHAALPYIPEAARYTILNVMRQQYQDGHLIRRWTPILETTYADAPAWLITTTCDYLKYTEDYSLLEEVVDYYDFGSDTVWIHLLKGLQRLDADRGPHNIPLSHFADWNDALNTGIRDKDAESVFVGMQLALCFREMAQLCRRIGKAEMAEEMEEKYADLSHTINDCCWDEEGYYIRSFANGKPIGSSKCEKGSKIYVNPQSWSIFSGVCPEERIPDVLAAVDKYLDTPVGCMVNAPAYTEYDPALGRISFQYPGTSENGAIYAHATSFKMYADCLLGLGDRAYRSYLQLLPSNPDNPPEVSDAVPYTLSNACSTADVCWGKSSALPWSTGTMAWLFKTVVEGLLGVRFAYGGFTVAPAFPSEWDKASITINRKGTDYIFRIINRNTGTKKIYVNDTLIDSDLVPFTDEEKVDIRVEL